MQSTKFLAMRKLLTGLYKGSKGAVETMRALAKYRASMAGSLGFFTSWPSKFSELVMADVRLLRNVLMKSVRNNLSFLCRLEWKIFFFI